MGIKSQPQPTPTVRLSHGQSYGLATAGQCEKKRQRIQRSLHFCEFVEVFPVLHVEDYSDMEIEATWYSKQDFKKCKNDRIETAVRFESGEMLHSDCMLGVESLTIDGCREREANILAAVNSVLNEQALQDLDDCENQDMIAHIYGLHTERCEIAARKRGKALAQETSS